MWDGGHRDIYWGLELSAGVDVAAAEAGGLAVVVSFVAAAALENHAQPLGDLDFYPTHVARFHSLPEQPRFLLFHSCNPQYCHLPLLR